MLISKDQLEASLCKQSFSDFVRRFWDVLIAEPLIWNWHMQYLCDCIQEAAMRVFKNLPKQYDYVFNVPPGTSKSTIASIMLTPWVWTNMASARVIGASYASDLALDLSRKCREVVKSDKYKKLFPHIKISETQDAKGYWANTAGGIRYAVGIGGSVMGFHGHFLVPDDPIDPQAASQMSTSDLKTANRWVGETLGSRKIDKEVTVTMLIMQRLHQNDPSAVMLGRQEQGVNIKHIKLPAEITGSGLEQVRPRKLARLYREGLLDPVRLNRKVLAEALVILGQFGYSGQMLQHPIPLGGGMFKVDRIRIDVPPPLADFRKIVRYWDKAGTAGAGCYTAGVLMGVDKRGHFWILDVRRGQWSTEQRENIIKQVAILDKIFVTIWVEQEPGSGGKESALATVRNLAGFNVRVDRPSGKKEIRADPFSVQVNGENVSMKEGPWNKLYLEEHSYFPYSTYKDQVDASSGAFAALTMPVRVGGLGR